MWLTNIELDVDKKSIDPRFLFRCDFEYKENSEVPISFQGTVLTSDEYRISKVDPEYDIYAGSSSIISIPLENSIKGSTVERDRKCKLTRNFSSQLSESAIQHIEDLRLKDPNKNVQLRIEIEVLLMKYECDDKKELKFERYFTPYYITIEQSKWLNTYAAQFGIGEFLIIEFPKQSIQINNQIKNDWIDKIDRAKTRLDEMNSFMNEGKWEKVIESSRKIWDIFKLRKEDKESKESLNLLFLKNNYSDSGFNDFLESIWSMHEFASKFIHDIAKKGGVMNPMPVPQKEDAYFIYLWAMGFINMLNEKIKSLEQ